jgi:hypothetical protein
VGFLVTAMLIIIVMLLINRSSNAAVNTLSSDVAAYQALQYANTGLPSGRLEGAPTDTMGMVTTYQQAASASVNGGMTLENRLDANKPVWLIVFQGRVVVNIPGSADGKIAPKDEYYSQMSVIIDGVTGEFLSATMHAPGDEIENEAFPKILLPQSPVQLPRAPLRPTTAPEPTALPAK